MPAHRPRPTPPPAPLRLHTEMVPEPLWYRNLRSAIGKKRWFRLRDAATTYRGRECEICGRKERGKERLHGHEVWSYDEKRKTGTATLTDIRLVCQDCSSIHHFGRFRNLLASNVITSEEFQRVMKRMRRINRCTIADWEAHVQEADEVWRRRSELSWEVDYGNFRWAVDYLDSSAAPARETRRRYETFRALDYDLDAMQAWIDMTPEERDQFGDDPEEFANAHDQDPEWWENLGIDPGEAHTMWWLRYQSPR